MSRPLIAAAAVVVVFAGFATSGIVPGAPAHTSPCHPQHTCPSDHHTYVWTDPTRGLSRRMRVGALGGSKELEITCSRGRVPVCVCVSLFVKYAS
jgi:hypothetical protein